MRSRDPLGKPALLPTRAQCEAVRQALVPVPGRSESMKYRQLGRSNLRVSEISLGSWLTYAGGVERSQAEACVRKALELGVNFLDTANVYGRGAAETFLGEVLRNVD